MDRNRPRGYKVSLHSVNSADPTCGDDGTRYVGIELRGKLVTGLAADDPAGASDEVRAARVGC